MGFRIYVASNQGEDIKGSERSSNRNPIVSYSTRIPSALTRSIENEVKMRYSSFSHHSTGFDVRWGTSFIPNPISIDFEMTHEWRKSSFLSQLVYSPNLTGGCRATPSDLRIGLLVGLLEWQAANSNDLKIKKREEKNKKQHKWYCLLLLLFGVTNGQKLFQMTEKWKNVKNIFRQIWTKTTGIAKMVWNDELTSKWDIPWLTDWLTD